MINKLILLFSIKILCIFSILFISKKDKIEYLITSENTIQSDSIDYVANYYPHIRSAEWYVYKKEYQKALNQYQIGFSKEEPLRKNLVDAAVVATKLNKIDVAINFLKDAIKKGTTLNFLKKHNKLKKLRRHKLWKGLLEEYSILRKIHTSKINHSLRDTILAIIKTDQEYRKNSKVFKNNITLQDSIDEANASLLQKIIINYGWPSENEIGIIEEKDNKIMAGIALPFHHFHKDSTRMNYFIEVMIEAVKKGEFSPEPLAAILDYNFTYRNPKQLYGSYRFFGEGKKISPLHDEENIDSLRTAIGLQPFKKYLIMNNFKYIWENNN